MSVLAQLDFEFHRKRQGHGDAHMSARHFDVPPTPEMMDGREREPSCMDTLVELNTYACCLVDGCFDLTSRTNNKPMVESQAKLNQKRWDDISERGPCGCCGESGPFEHPSVGPATTSCSCCPCCCCSGTYCPELFLATFDPSESFGKTVSASRGEKHCGPKSCHMGVAGWTVCCFFCWVHSPMVGGSLSVHVRTKLQKRYGLRPEQAFYEASASKSDPCDHPCCIYCCYPYALWKHSVFVTSLAYDQVREPPSSQTPLIDKTNPERVQVCR